MPRAEPAFPGLLDDLRIYPAALEGGQVQAVYEGADELIPAAFTSDPVAGSDGMEDIPYAASLAGHVTGSGAGEERIFAKRSGPAWLYLAADGSLSGTPAAGDIGTNEFVVRVTDAAGFVDEAVLRIRVNVFSGNHPPVFTTDPLGRPAAVEDAAYAGQSLAGGATDVDAGDTLTFSRVSGPTWLTVAADGTLGGTPAQADVGANTFTVRVTDGGSLSDVATLLIVVSNVNDAPIWPANPVAEPDAWVDVAYGGTLAGQAADEDVGDGVSFIKLSGPAWLGVDAGGALSGTPAMGDLGTNAFTVRAQDVAGLHADATLLIAVAGLAPVITSQPQSVTAQQGSTTSFTVGVRGTLPLSFQWFFNANSALAGATNAALALAGLTTNQAGAYRVLVSNAFGIALSSNATLVVSTGLTLGEALDAPALVWTNGGTGVWTSQVATTHDGVDAAQSGRLNASRTNWVQTTVLGPGNLGYWWKVSSESGYDYLTFSIDGVTSRRISGEVNWALATNRLTAGAHTLRWAYGKDNSMSNGQDRGWVDQVTYMADPPVVALMSPTNGARYVATSRVSLAATVISNGQVVTEVLFLRGTNVMGSATGPYQLTWSNLTAGSHALVARAVYRGGNGQVDSATVLVDVLSLWQTWRERAFSGGTWTNESVAGLSADPDGDGQDNRTEYGYGTDPTVSNAWPLLTCEWDGVAQPVILYPRRLEPSDAVYTEESSTDAVTWSTGQTQFISLTPGTNGETGTVRTRLDGSPAMFFRLRMSLP